MEQDPDFMLQELEDMGPGEDAPEEALNGSF